MGNNVKKRIGFCFFSQRNEITSIMWPIFTHMTTKLVIKSTFRISKGGSEISISIVVDYYPNWTEVFSLIDPSALDSRLNWSRLVSYLSLWRVNMFCYFVIFIIYLCSRRAELCETLTIGNLAIVLKGDGGRGGGRCWLFRAETWRTNVQVFLVDEV